MINVEIGAQQLCSILKHDTEKKIYNTLWVKYTKYCKNMFKLWIKRKGKKNSGLSAGCYPNSGNIMEVVWSSRKLSK